jgi:hypothetical protein
MKKIGVLLCHVLLIAPYAHSGSAPSVRHAYFLFMQGGSKNCEDCYIPLLLTQAPIEKAIEGKPSKNGFLIITYERDSIWEIKDDPVELNDISTEERKVQIGGVTYRYQEIHPKEAASLLYHPEGHIPVHRMSAPVKEHQKIIIEKWIRELEDIAR